MAGLRLHLDSAAIQRYLHAPGYPVYDRVAEVGRAVAAASEARAPRRTGQLVASITVEVDATPTGVTARIIATAPYAVYVHQGTGVYAGRGPIRPRRAGGFLVFEAGGQRVFARQVRGQPGQPFLVQGLLAASPWPVTIHNR